MVRSLTSTLILGALGVGFVLGSFTETARLKDFLNNIRPIRNAIAGYEYTAPLLGLNAPPATDIGFFIKTRSAIQTLAEQHKRDGTLVDYGVYKRDLNTSLWFGVNEDSIFLPASLYKLPIALIVYKEIEDGVVDPSARLTYRPAASPDPLVATTTLRAGVSYTASELVEHMLEDSDNGAKSALAPIVRDEYVQKLWQIVNIGSPHPDEQISVRDYSFFFRLLYSSTYLDVENSEKILGLLAHSTYTHALADGIPADIQIAHKWGLYNLEKQGENGHIELHDCGIIYAPNNPYLLCVMTKGQSQDALESFIAHVSAIVYADAVRQ